jgi:hypothetical protein
MVFINVRPFKFLLIYILILSSYFCNAQKQDCKENSELCKFLIKTLWSIDTCGEKGYKGQIIFYLLENNDSINHLLGCDTNKITFLFGKPNFRYVDDNGDIVYQYYSMLAKDPNGVCFHPPQLEGNGIAMRFENKTYTIIRYYHFME